MTEPLAQVETTRDPGGLVVRVLGEVDMSNADTVGDQVRAATRPSEAATLRLDAVTFFDSSALHMLHKLSDDFDRAGGRLTVVLAPDSIVGRVLAITHMDAYLHVSEQP
jgi:anti-anti-sigma factor